MKWELRHTALTARQSRILGLGETMFRTFEKEDIAKRYDSARALTEGTSDLWMTALAAALPPDFAPDDILDLGAGTGRFAVPLHTTFHCRVHAVEPAEAMMGEGKRNAFESVVWYHGSAENIPLETGSMELVWMSQTLHHFENLDRAFQEIRRVLRPGGCLAIRNGTKENMVDLEWLRCFPDAERIDKTRLPARQELVDLASKYGFVTVSIQTVYQCFASSYSDYYDKISRRGLSALIAISDEAFEAGLCKLRDWVDKQPPDKPVNEPVDLFVFRVDKTGECPTTESDATRAAEK